MPRRIGRLILELFVYLILLEIGLRVGGIIFLSLQRYGNSPARGQEGEYRIMCLGESNTAAGGKDSYPSQLEEVLNGRGMAIKFKTINCGLPATNTDFILYNLEGNLDRYNPHMVITMMGNSDKGERIQLEAKGLLRAAPFLRSLRTYKLARLLWLELRGRIRRINEAGEERALLESLELNPGNDSLYVDLGKFYYRQGRYADAGKALKRALEINPQNDSSYRGLIWFYLDQKAAAVLEEVLKKAVELNPRNDSAYVHLGIFYSMNKYAEAENSLKRALELNPDNDFAYEALARLYYKQGRFSEAENALKRALELNPDNDFAYAGLATIYSLTGKEEFYDAHAGKADRLRTEYYRTMTVRNYRALKDVLDKRKIRLVCMQYPMRNIFPLKRILDGEEGVIFVDNEKIFKEAVKKEGYGEYFLDMNGGDFGHCTRKGNRMLADNIANVILTEVFGKDASVLPTR